MSHKFILSVLIIISTVWFVMVESSENALSSKKKSSVLSCPVNQTQCCNYPPCSTGSPCYNPANQSCCGMYQDDCWRPQICNSKQFCCLPWYGCEYAGSPVCCAKGDSCCSSRHGAMCAGPDEQCCDGMGEPGVCPKNTTCCPGYWGSQCCGAGTTCCQSSNIENLASCCNSATEVCNKTSGTCVKK